MSNYRVVEKIGRAGSAKNRERVKAEWDKKYGVGNYLVGYVYQKQILTRDEALEQFYNTSYVEYMKKQSKITQTLVQTAKELFNPHALFTTGVDLQVPAVLNALKVLGLELQGTQKVAIGTFQPKFWTPQNEALAKQYDIQIVYERAQYHKLAKDLSPYTVPFHLEPSMNIEDFWQNYKYLLVKN